MIRLMGTRTSGMLRVPFVQRCALDFDDGQLVDAFLVNINVMGAYVAHDGLARLGQRLQCRFKIPGNEIRVSLAATVAWVNARQQHPVHSLPPGFGLKFEGIASADLLRVEAIVQDYVARHPPPR
jgi:Tfp pilus assembly protein PilZ